MAKISKKERDNLIKILQAGNDIPEKYQDILFANEQKQKEYELTYDGKARKEDIIADTLAAPLQEVRTFNSDNKFDDNWTNKLIFGDNLMVLKNLYEDPCIKGKIKLIYIDPPFATKQDFMKDEEKAYKDKIVGSKFIEFTRKRLVFLRELLAEDGSIYVHLDQKKGHYIKVIMDEIFGENYFLNEIAWCYQGAGQSERLYKRKHDSIFFYSKNRQYLFNWADVGIPIGEKQKIKYTGKDSKGYFKSYKHKDGKVYKKYLDENEIMPQLDYWTDVSIIQSSNERIDYPTQKPEALLDRIVRASSNVGDIVLDAFAGSGTTLAVSEKLKRRWIGIDCGKLAIYTMQKRILNLREEIGNKGKSLKAKAFTLYNAGLYDWTEVKNLDFNHYRDFVLKLFQVREEKHTSRGIEIDGYIGNENAYLWNHTKEKKAKLDLDFVKSLHNALSGKGGEVFYLIAPSTAFAFFEDEIRFDDTLYKTLRVPQSVITELIKRGGEELKQPTSEQDVNDTIDAVGFDFIQVPDVEVEYKIGNPKEKNLLNQKTKECVIKLKTFKSRTLTKSPEEFENFETLSMVMIDYNYDGKVFDLDEVFYADNLKPEYEVRFDIGKLDKQMMVIYLDIYGNEKKEILRLKDFKK
ncbi:MAG TPA: site-specific DNA-methyltransferase [bacterium]|nr:site-specific DNA-methyltransferase [bacterium]